MTESRTTHAGQDRASFWIDLMILGGGVALYFSVTQVAAEWRHPLTASTPLDLSLGALPRYALYSFARGWIAYFFSLIFTIVVAAWAFYDPRTRRYIIPALDILQSIPVLAFLPGFTLALVALFPHSNAGIELVCILTIFVGQVWNMVFSYYDSLRAVPGDFRMLGNLYNFTWWDRLWRIELPFGAQGLLYNSMVSMAGGWFYLSVSEAPPPINNVSLRVPGLGSYIQEAVDAGNTKAYVFGIIAMGIVILVVDRLIWWPLVLWSRKFKLDDFGGSRGPKSQIQLWFARSRSVQAIGAVWTRVQSALLPSPKPPSEATSLLQPGAEPAKHSPLARWLYLTAIWLLVALLGWGAFRLFLLLKGVGLSDWLEILRDTGWSLLRVMTAVLIGTLWTVPLGVWIGLNPKLSGKLQPFIQFAASFPAPMVYPLLLGAVLLLHGTLQWGSILLILFGTQWYILFNVAGSAAAIPNDIASCAEILHLSGWRRWAKYLIPAVFPGLVTGWLTAAGGAWNATIVSEIVTIRDKTYEATGLGAYISRATAANNFPTLTAAVIVMAIVVVGINRTVWKRLQTVANDRCRFIA